MRPVEAKKPESSSLFLYLALFLHSISRIQGRVMSTLNTNAEQHKWHLSMELIKARFVKIVFDYF